MHDKSAPNPLPKSTALNHQSPHSLRNKIGRVLWNTVWTIFYRPSPKICHGWRRFLLRSFGAKIGRAALPYPSAKIWAPWNLEMGDHSCLSENVDCYCVARISIGSRAAVSQYSFLCTATHDIETSDLALHTAPIVIHDGAWIAADVFVGPGVTIGTGAVVGARASVFRDVPDGGVAIGTPAKCVRRRTPQRPTSTQSASLNRLALEPRLQCALCSGFDCETAIPFPDIPVLRCKTCGFLYSGEVMPAKILANYYANDFASRRHLLGQRLNAEMNFSVLKKILNPPKGISVLDAGCGYGFLLRLLRDKRQADVTGVEISKRQILHAKEALGLVKIYPSVSEIPSGRLFNLVTCFEVIEHIREPVPFVRELLKRVAPGGCLVMMTDNFDSPVSHGMGCEFPKWIPHSHISHFSPETLGKCLNRAGAENVLFYSHTPWEILALAVKSRLSAAKPPSACFCLDAVLATEMNRPFRLFALRKLLNKFWAPLSLKPNKKGSLMYAVVHPSHP
jgi:putative colanic acid biosynthesis acetyltransferase WcaF